MLPVSGAAVGWCESMTDKTCGALGCRNDATYRIDTDDHGERVVCDDHTLPGTIVTKFTNGTE